MKSISKRTETFYTIELNENQITTIIVALGLTTKQERESDAISFYHVKDFMDDENLIESLAKLIGLEEKNLGKIPETPIVLRTKPLY
jgi:hypothetical protein